MSRSSAAPRTPRHAQPRAIPECIPMPNHLALLCVLFPMLLATATHARAEHDASLRDREFGGDTRCSVASRPGDCAVVFDTPGSSLRDAGQAVLRTADGRYVLVADVAMAGGAPDAIGLTRRLRNGAADGAFGNAGRIVHALGFDGVRAAAIDAQDRILVAGDVVAAPDDEDLAVARFNADGRLDTGFGVNGVRHVSCGSDYETAADLAVDGAGRILLAGRFSGPAGTSAGACMATLDATGTPAAGTPYLLYDTDDARHIIDGIDVAGTNPRMVVVAQCLTPTCGAGGIVALYHWDQPPAAMPLAFAVVGPGLDVGTCSAARPTLLGPMALSPDGTRSTLLVESYDGDEDESTYLLITFDTADGTTVTCLDGIAPNSMFPAMILSTADGSDDLYLLGDHYTAGNDTRHEGVRRLLRGDDGRYVADDGFDGGQPRQVRVAGQDGVLYANEPAQTNRRALVDPGVPGDLPPLPQLVVAGARKYAASGEDHDVYVARLGGDTALFADGMESP